MKSVWLVESGEYSDYSVNAIFETEEQAQAFSTRLVGSWVREWELNTWTEDQASFRVKFDLNGNITETVEKAWIDETGADRIHSYRPGKDQITITVGRGPRELAIKIASEQYIRIRAHLDEADRLMERAEMADPELRAFYQAVGEHAGNYSLRVARILAGIEQAPNPPRCKADRDMLFILAGLPSAQNPQNSP